MILKKAVEKGYMNSNMMLVAEKHNWGLGGFGKWKSVTWIVNYDMSYTIITKHNPDQEAWEREDLPSPVRNTYPGEMKKDDFTALKTLLETDQWRTPGLEIHACDGEAWKIDFYSVDGELIRSSGELGYIYGEKVLQKIVSMLPDTNDSYDESAFIQIKRK